MRGSLRAGHLPAGDHLRAVDEISGAGVPGLLAGELEQERLPARQVDDRRPRFGLHEDPCGPAGAVGDLPSFDDERLKCTREVVVVDRAEGRRLESSGERGSRASAGHVGELRQTSQVDSDRQCPLNCCSARHFDRLLEGQGISQCDEQLRQGLLGADVLHLVDVDQRDDVTALHRGSTDLDQELGQGRVRLRPWLVAQREGDACGGDRLDTAEELTDAPLARGGEPCLPGDLEQGLSHLLQGIGARWNAQLRRHPVPSVGGIRCDPAHQRRFSETGLAEHCSPTLRQAGESSRTKHVAPVAELCCPTSPHLRDRVGARTERRVKRSAHADNFIKAESG